MKNAKTTLLIVGMVLSMALNKTYAQTAPIKLILEKHGEHRLSKYNEIETIKFLINKISKT